MTNTTIVELTIAQYDTLFAFEFLGSRACREKKDGNKMQDKSKKENSTASVVLVLANERSRTSISGYIFKNHIYIYIISDTSQPVELSWVPSFCTLFHSCGSLRKLVLSLNEGVVVIGCVS
jgi:hypothetical protein